MSQQNLPEEVKAAMPERIWVQRTSNRFTGEVGVAYGYKDDELPDTCYIREDLAVSLPTEGEAEKEHSSKQQEDLTKAMNAAIMEGWQGDYNEDATFEVDPALEACVAVVQSLVAEKDARIAELEKENEKLLQLANGKPKKTCPKCGSERVIMFTADMDMCQACNHQFYP